jgi:hypothetical protein
LSDTGQRDCGLKHAAGQSDLRETRDAHPWIGDGGIQPVSDSVDLFRNQGVPILEMI